MVTVLGQILEGFLKDAESASVDAPTAQRMGRLLQSMQVTLHLTPRPLPFTVAGGHTIYVL